ncbi:MAG: helix-turn-helix domain-containing protein [Patescibacteria group bacterium]
MALVSIRDLRRMRETRGLTREVAAERMGVSVSALQRAEEGSRPPSWRLIRSAAKLYGEVEVNAPEGAFCVTHIYRSPRISQRQPTLEESCEAAAVLARFFGHTPVPRPTLGYLLEEIAAESAEAEQAVTCRRKALLGMFGELAPPGEGEEAVFTEAVIDPLGPIAAGFVAYVTQHRGFVRRVVEKRMARASSEGAAPAEMVGA